MNNKIIITLLVSCLMQACTKNESTEKASSNTAQTEAAKANTTDSQQFIEQGKNDIATYGKETLQYLLDQKHPDSYTAFTVDIMSDSCASNLLIFSLHMEHSILRQSVR